MALDPLMCVEIYNGTPFDHNGVSQNLHGISLSVCPLLPSPPDDRSHRQLPNELFLTELLGSESGGRTRAGNNV